MAARPILTLACLATVAHASPRTDPAIGRAVFTGATRSEATSIGLNPAALGAGKAGEIFVALVGALDQVGVARRALDADTGTLTPEPRQTTRPSSLGGMVGLVVHAGERYTIGVQAYVPPREQFIGGTPALESLRYHARGGGQRNYLATISGSFRVTSRFYFGASLSHDNTFLDLRYARDTALANGYGPRGIDSDCGDGARCGIENPAASELYRVDVRSPLLSASNFRVNLGLLAEIYPDVLLGVAYHTPPGFGIQTELAGDVEIERAARDGGGLLRGGSTVYVSYPASVDAEVRARLIRGLDLHVGGRWEDLSRMQAYDVRAYNSTFVANDIPEWTLRPRGLHDAFAVWAGVEQVYTGAGSFPLRFGARLGYETSALALDAQSPLTISPSSVTLDVGAEWRIAPNWMLQLAYGVQYFPEVVVDDSAYDPRFTLDCIESGYDYATVECAAVRTGFGIPSAAGSYTRTQHAMRLGLRYEFPP